MAARRLPAAFKSKKSTDDVQPTNGAPPPQSASMGLRNVQNTPAPAPAPKRRVTKKLPGIL